MKTNDPSTDPTSFGTENTKRQRMPLTFFSLPREIRDQIYIQILASETGIVIFLPSPYFSSQIPGQRHTKRKPTKGIPQEPLSLINEKLIIQEFTPWARQEYTLSSTQRITLNITQTCRQIHSETKGMFWDMNRVWGGGVRMWKLVQEVRSKQWENIELEEENEVEERLVEIT